MIRHKADFTLETQCAFSALLPQQFLFVSNVLWHSRTFPSLFCFVLQVQSQIQRPDPGRGQAQSPVSKSLSVVYCPLHIDHFKGGGWCRSVGVRNPQCPHRSGAGRWKQAHTGDTPPLTSAPSNTANSRTAGPATQSHYGPIAKGGRFTSQSSSETCRKANIQQQEIRKSQMWLDQTELLCLFGHSSVERRKYLFCKLTRHKWPKWLLKGVFFFATHIGDSIKIGDMHSGVPALLLQLWLNNGSIKQS